MRRAPGRGDDPGIPRIPGGARVSAQRAYQEMPTPAGAADVESTHKDIVPAKMGRYVILRQLGSGGMGVVYAAYDEHLDRKVALKLLSERSDRADAQARMLREAQALARLDHPNVVAIHDVGLRDGQVFLAMEFLAGMTLREWLAADKRTPAEILAVFIEAGRGLAAAHAVGLVHRDFKPDNVMVGADGRVRVFDFGLARTTGTAEFAARASRVRPVDEPTDVTVTGAAVGTPAYMSPEQHMGRATDARTDIYSFCVALYEAFYCERPFDGATKDEIANAVIRGERRPLPRSSVPARLRRVILRGLDVDPDARWPTMTALLEALADDPVRRRRRRLLIAGAALITLAGALALPYAAVRLYAEWQHEQREQAAARRWETTRAQIDALEASGRREQAERLFTAFTSSEEQLGTRALARAWLDHGGRALMAGDTAAATVSFAEAYVVAGDPDLEAETLRAMAGLFLRNNDWRALHSILEALRSAGREGDPGVPAMRAEAAIADRDFVGARARIEEALAGSDEPPPIARALPMLGVLAQAERVPYRGAEASFADIDGDGRSELLLLAGDWRSITVLDQGLRLLATHHLPADQRDGHLVPGRPLVVGFTGRELVLASVGADLSERWRGPAESWAYSLAAADVDGRPGEELYIGLAAYRRGLHVARPLEGERVPLEIAHLGTDHADSDVTDVMIHDLDGDGEPEVVASVGPWKAYDLRVFRPTSGGALELVDRLQLGHVMSVAPLRLADGTTVIAAAKDDRWPDHRVFPEPPHLGWPAGIYLIGLRDGRLERRAHIPPIPHPSARRMIYGARLRSGDFDGDGLQDLAITQDHGSEHLDYASLILRQHAGGFTPIPLTATQILGAGDLDDDPEPELLIADSTQGNALWLLGRGQEALPRAISGEDPLPTPPPQLLDQGLREGWVRAERLADIGLFETAAESLHATALITSSPAQARLLLSRAAALRAAGGDHEGAVELYQLLAERAGLDDLSRREAARSYVRLSRYDEAYRVLAGGDLEIPGRGPVDLTRADLRSIVDARRLLDITFDRPLPALWRIHDPLALARDADADALLITAFNGDAPVADLPLAWDRGPLVLSAELTLVHSEFAGDLEIALADADGAAIAGFHVQTRGGGGLYSHQLSCHHEGSTNEVTIASWPFTGADERRRVKVDVVVLPDRNLATCRVEGEPGEVEVSLPAHVAPGPARLVLGSNVRRDSYATYSEVALHRLTIRGGGPAIAGEVDDGPRARAARLLGEGEPAAALRLLGELAAPTARDHLWRAVARFRLGDLDGARDDLARALEDGAADPLGEPQLRFLLRRLPGLAPLLRRVLGPAYYDHYLAAWGAAIDHHPDEPFVRDALTDAVSELATPDELPRTPAIAQLLAARGRIWLDIDELERARRELGAAERIADEVPLADAIRFRLAVALAELAVRSGDRPRARSYLDRALGLTRTPELAIERLRRHPRLAELVPAAGPAAIE